MAYHGHPIDLKTHTRLSLMAASIMAGCEDYSAENAVLEAVRLDREVQAHLKREEDKRKAEAKEYFASGKGYEDMRRALEGKRGFLG